MKLLIILLIALCLLGYFSIKNEKYVGIRKVLPTVCIFFICILVFMCFLDIVRYQIGFSEFFKGLFSGF